MNTADRDAAWEKFSSFALSAQSIAERIVDPTQRIMDGDRQFIRVAMLLMLAEIEARKQPKEKQ